MKLDIVIPCAGRVADLLRLLESLDRQCSAFDREQVVSVVASDDRWSEALGEQVRQRFPSLRYVRGPARGPAANRNHGATQGRAPWILFLDDDCYVESDLLAAYAALMQSDPAVDVWEGAIHPVGPRPNGNHHAPLNLDGGWMWSCNLLVRRSTFEAVRGFDEVFPFACMEDCDLRERLRASGARARFAREAAVLHPWRSISEREVSRAVISHAIYAQRHPEFVRGWTLTHLLRALRGRWRQYASGRPGSIPLGKYRTVGMDLAAPVAVYLLMRLAPLRRRISRRWANSTTPQPKALR